MDDKRLGYWVEDRAYDYRTKDAFEKHRIEMKEKDFSFEFLMELPGKDGFTCSAIYKKRYL